MMVSRHPRFGVPPETLGFRMMGFASCLDGYRRGSVVMVTYRYRSLPEMMSIVRKTHHPQISSHHRGKEKSTAWRGRRGGGRVRRRGRRRGRCDVRSHVAASNRLVIHCFRFVQLRAMVRRQRGVS